MNIITKGILIYVCLGNHSGSVIMGTFKLALNIIFFRNEHSWFPLTWQSPCNAVTHSLFGSVCSRVCECVCTLMGIFPMTSSS